MSEAAIVLIRLRLSTISKGMMAKNFLRSGVSGVHALHSRDCGGYEVSLLPDEQYSITRGIGLAICF